MEASVNESMDCWTTTNSSAVFSMALWMMLDLDARIIEVGRDGEPATKRRLKAVKKEENGREKTEAKKETKKAQ